MASYLLTRVRPVINAISKIESEVSFLVIGKICYAKGGIPTHDIGEVVSFAN